MIWKQKNFYIALAIPLAAGGLATLFSGGMGDFGALNQPPLSPPGWVFPVVWSILYLLMGYSSYRIFTADSSAHKIRSALKVYVTQLAVNFLWPIVFFGLEQYLMAFVVLLVLWVLIFWTLRDFSKIDEIAGDLLIPYLLWVTFAGYLNISIYFLN